MRGTVRVGPAVAEELAIERIHLLHRLGAADEHLVAGVGAGGVVVALQHRARVPGGVIPIVIRDPLGGHVGQEVHRLRVGRQAGVGSRGEPFDGLFARGVVGGEHQQLLVDLDRRVGAVLLLVLGGQRLEGVDELRTNVGVGLRHRIRGEKLRAQFLDPLFRERLGLREREAAMQRIDVLVGVSSGLGPTHAQVPGHDGIGVAFLGLPDEVPRAVEVVVLESLLGEPDGLVEAFTSSWARGHGRKTHPEQGCISNHRSILRGRDDGQRVGVRSEQMIHGG